MRSLAVFDGFVRENAGEPERIKAVITRFVDYVVWHPGEKGEGQLEVSIFPNLAGTPGVQKRFSSAFTGAFYPGMGPVGNPGAT